MSPATQSLSAIPLFAGVPGPTLARLEAAAVQREFPAGAEIINEGEGGVGFYLIDEGSATVSRAGSDRILRTLKPGDYFGEMALFDGHRRSASVKAVEPIRLRVLTRWDFLAEVRSNPELAIHLREKLSRDARDAGDQPEA
jgi:CRP-like cAMP-binding protein